MICHHAKTRHSFSVPHTIQFILMTDLFCSLKFAPLNFSYLFLSFLDLLPLRQPPVLCICESVSVMSVHLHCFLRSHIWVKACSICFSLSDLFHLALYRLGPSMLLQTVRWNCSVLCGSLEGRGVWETVHMHINIQYIHVYVWLSPSTVHLKLS